MATVDARKSGWLGAHWRALLRTGAVVGLTVGVLSLVNGRWLHTRSRGGTTTVTGAIVISIATFVVVVVAVALFVQLNSAGRARRSALASSTSDGEVFYMSGFAGSDTYTARCPDWQSGPAVGMPRALDEAEAWVAQNGDDAVVEVRRDETVTSVVIGLVSKSGFERVAR